MSKNFNSTIKLPDSWRWVRLGDVCTQDRQIVEPNSNAAKNLPYLSLEHIESQTGKIFRHLSGRIQDEGKSTTFRFDSRHILYGKLRPYLNKVALPDFEGRCTTEAIPLLVGNEMIREFLSLILRRDETVKASMQQKTGSRMPRANMDELMKLKILLPPLPEQKRIAAILNEQMAAVEKARAAAEAQREAAKVLSGAYLRKVFKYRTGDKLPEGWRWVKVKDICSQIDYGYTASADFNCQFPKFLRITDIQNGNVVWDKVPGCQINNTDEEPCRLIDGDIVFARTGGTTGKSFLIKSPPRSVFASYLIRLRPNKEILPDFLYSFFQSDLYWKQIKDNARGGAQSNVNATLLSDITFPLPHLPEQKRIAAILNEQMADAERLRKSVDEQLNTIKSLPASLLRQAFGGKL